jgi:hypothetical protein
MLGMARPLLLEIIEQFLVINSTERFLKFYTDLMMLSGSEKELVGGQGISSKGKLVMTQSRQPKKKGFSFFLPIRRRRRIGNYKSTMDLCTFMTTFYAFKFRSSYCPNCMYIIDVKLFACQIMSNF